MNGRPHKLTIHILANSIVVLSYGVKRRQHGVIYDLDSANILSVSLRGSKLAQGFDIQYLTFNIRQSVNKIGNLMNQYFSF